MPRKICIADKGVYPKISFPRPRSMRCCPCVPVCPCPSPPVAECFVQILQPVEGAEYQPGQIILGIATPSCSVRLFIDSLFFTSVDVDSQGRWQTIAEEELAPGNHTIVAQVICPQGLCRDGRRMTDRTSVEVPPIVCPPAVISSPEVGDVLSLPSPTIIGEGVPLSTISLCLVDASQTQVFCVDVPVEESGRWNLITPVALPPGDYTILATQLGVGCGPTPTTRSFSVISSDIGIALTLFARGPVFRTISMAFTAFGPNIALNIYYVLLTPDQPVPTEEEVIDYNNPITLQDGNAARGQFQVSITPASQTFPFTLTGKENITPLPLETGIMDGFNYYIYLVATAPGFSSGVLTVSNQAIGMPFASGNGVIGDPFFVRMCTPAEMAFYPDLTAGNPGNRAGVTENARILDNIEGMQVLYDQSKGVHGLENSLSLQYTFDSAFDLTNYAAAYNGMGWRPIGNVDVGLTLSGLHIFTGSAQTPPGGTTISNLTMTPKASALLLVRIIGFFGATNGANLQRFTLPNPLVNVFASASASALDIGAVGCLVGRFQNGTLSDITLGTANVTASRQAGGSNRIYVGSIAGEVSLNATVNTLSVNQAQMTEAVNGTCYVGGVLGNVDQRGGLITLNGIQINLASIAASSRTGGIIAVINSGVSSAQNLHVVQTNISATGPSAGGVVGAMFASATTNISTMLVDSVDISAPALAACGGLIGGSVTTAATTITDSSVAQAVLNARNNCGGAFGLMQVNTPSLLIARINTQNVTASTNGNTVGGVFGFVELMNSAAGPRIEDCHSTNAVLQGGSFNAGGFAGAVLRTSTSDVGGVMMVLADCTAQATESADQQVGGFLGQSSFARFERCHCTSTGTGNFWLGGFVGLVNNPLGLLRSEFVLCSSRGSLTSAIGTDHLDQGGFGGFLIGAQVDRCFSTSSLLSSARSHGGLIGVCEDACEVFDSYATSNVPANDTLCGSLIGAITNSTVNHTYASGNAQGTTMVAGLVGEVLTGASVSNSISLASTVQGNSTSVHRIANPSSGTLSNNAANSAMVLLDGATPITPVSNPNGPDGASMPLANLAATMTSLGFNTTTVWNTATIATLGRPTLLQNPE